MQSIDLLVQEHQAIETTLAALESGVARLGRGGTVRVDLLTQILAFLQQYVDGRHHAKEEEHLFPVLRRHGLGPDHSLVNALMAQHEIGRAHVRDMRAALTRIGRDDPEAWPALATSAQAYAELLREHIRIENEHFYQLAARLLSTGEDEALVREFAEVDRAYGQTDLREAVTRFEAASAAWYREDAKGTKGTNTTKTRSL